jgi:hypothetical protein
VYGFSGPDFTYCLDECRIGGQKLLKDKNTAPISVSAKMARSYDSCVRDYCSYAIYAWPVYAACQATCYSVGRIGSLDTVSDTMEPYPFTYSKVDGKKFLPDHTPATSNNLPAQPMYSGQFYLSSIYAFLYFQRTDMSIPCAFVDLQIFRFKNSFKLHNAFY